MMSLAEQAPDPTKAPERERHEYLSRMLKDYHDGLIDFAFKHGVLLTAILGWVVSSQTAQDFFRSAQEIRYVSIGTMLLYAAAHVLWVRRWYLKSNRVFSELAKLNYMPVAYYETQRVTIFMASMFVVVHVLVSCAVVLFLLRL